MQSAPAAAAVVVSQGRPSVGGAFSDSTAAEVKTAPTDDEVPLEDSDENTIANAAEARRREQREVTDDMATMLPQIFISFTLNTQTLQWGIHE